MPEDNQTKLFVGGLPFSTTADDLKQLFGEAGEVADATVITDRFSGRSRGFGFVTMATKEQADAAIQKLNGTMLEGRKIIVAHARPREERPPRGPRE